MSVNTKGKQKNRTSQAYLNSLIDQDPEANARVISIDNSSPMLGVLSSKEEYDSSQPEETIKRFCADIRWMLSRFEGNKNRLAELENEMQDVLHYIEMSETKNASVGYKLYRKLSDIRRERRQCKNEIEILRPVYDAFHGTTLLNQLSMIQGQCGSMKKNIDSKGYSIRTDVLKECGFCQYDPDEKEK